MDSFAREKKITFWISSFSELHSVVSCLLQLWEWCSQPVFPWPVCQGHDSIQQKTYNHDNMSFWRRPCVAADWCFQPGSFSSLRALFTRESRSWTVNTSLPLCLPCAHHASLFSSEDGENTPKSPKSLSDLQVLRLFIFFIYSSIFCCFLFLCFSSSQSCTVKLLDVLLTLADPRRPASLSSIRSVEAERAEKLRTRCLLLGLFSFLRCSISSESHQTTIRKHLKVVLIDFICHPAAAKPGKNLFHDDSQSIRHSSGVKLLLRPNQLEKTSVPNASECTKASTLWIALMHSETISSGCGSGILWRKWATLRECSGNDGASSKTNYSSTGGGRGRGGSLTTPGQTDQTKG